MKNCQCDLSCKVQKAWWRSNMLPDGPDCFPVQAIASKTLMGFQFSWWFHKPLIKTDFFGYFNASDFQRGVSRDDQNK